MLKIDLEYYDSHHENLLATGIYQNLGTAARVSAFQSEIAGIPVEDFLNYLLIPKAASSEYASYAKRLANIEESIFRMRNVMDITKTINWRAGSDRLREEVGEAVSLSVASSLFGLTAADWAVIPIQRGRKADPTFDFEETITGVTAGNAVIQIEAKGSFVADNALQKGAVEQQAQKIAEKKTKINSRGSNYKHPAAARFGMIASIDPTHTAKCWLLDPPADPIDGEPMDMKIANRLDYVASIISLLAPKAQILSALTERAALWRQGKALDAGVLRTPKGHAFSAGYYVEDFFAKGKIWLPERDVVGKMFVGRYGERFFIGLQGNVIRQAIDQEPMVIASSRYRPKSETLDLSGDVVSLDSGFQVSSATSRFVFHTCSSGLLIGLESRH